MADKAPPFPTSQVTIPAYSDNYPLGGYVVNPKEPSQESPVMVVATATAVPCKFYLPYLWFLASQGISGVAFDYRGTHSSLQTKTMIGSNVTAEDWGTKDLAGVLEFTAATFPGKKIVHFGHSVGGHIMPWPHNRDLISHAITLGTQNAFYHLTPFRHRHQVFWNVMVPGACSIFGYFPGSKLQIVGDAPVGVMKEWRSWAYNPAYIAGMDDVRRERYQKFDKPILAISADDDEYATRLGVQLFHEKLASPVQFWHIEHSDLPGKFPIRHVGFLLPIFAKTLWPQTVPFIKSGVLPDVSTLKPSTPPTTDLHCRL